MKGCETTHRKIIQQREVEGPAQLTVVSSSNSNLIIFPLSGFPDAGGWGWGEGDIETVKTADAQINLEWYYKPAPATEIL